MALPSDAMNLGPLTTVFTAPLACSTDALYVNNNRDCAGSVSVLRGPVATSSGGRCFPPGFDGRAGAYYSPGLCPHGYTVACTSVVGGRRFADATAAAYLPEPVLTCCPQAAQGLTYGCSAGPEWSWGGCHATLGGATATLTGATTVECGTTRDAGSAFVWDGVAQAQSVQVRFRAGDESLFETGRDTAPTTATSTPATAPSSPNRATPAAGSTEPAMRASDHVQAATAGAGSPVAAHTALVAVAASCGAVLAVAMAVAALLFVRARRVARELRDREKELSDRFYHAAKPSHGGGDSGPGDEGLGTVVTVMALGATATPTTSPAPVVAAPAPSTSALAARPPDVSPLSVATARLADVAAPAELGTAPQYEMEGSPAVRQQRGRQAPFPPPAPAPPLVQTESSAVGKAATTTQEQPPVSEAESPA